MFLRKTICALTALFLLLPALAAQDPGGGSAPQPFGQEPAGEPVLSDPDLPQDIPSGAGGDDSLFENPFEWGDKQEFDSDFADPSRMPGWMGRSANLGQTDMFDKSFNPAIGVVIDFLGEYSDVRNGIDRYNQFRVRTLELNLASRIDPLGWAYVVVAFVDNGAENEVELEEAAMWLDRLPENFSLRGGRFLADIGKWNTIHTHDKPYVSEDLVRREFLGGPLFTTGLEVHQWFGLGDMPVRWSLGVGSEFEGDDHDVAAGESLPGFGRLGVGNWGLTGRLTGQLDVGDNGYFQWGLSGVYLPNQLEFNEFPPGSGLVLRNEIENAVALVDLTWRDVNATDLSADTISVELWYQTGENLSTIPGLLLEDDNFGAWGFWEHAFDPQWRAGAVAAWVERRNGGSVFDAGGNASNAGIFLTYYLSEFNRLRLQVNYNDSGTVLFGKFWTIALQWDVIMGAHAHAIDW